MNQEIRITGLGEKPVHIPFGKAQVSSNQRIGIIHKDQDTSLMEVIQEDDRDSPRSALEGARTEYNASVLVQEDAVDYKQCISRFDPYAPVYVDTMKNPFVFPLQE